MVYNVFQWEQQMLALSVVQPNTFPMSLACQLIEVVCHSAQFADIVCLFGGKACPDMAISDSHSNNLTCRYSCVLGFEFHCIVLFGCHLDRYAVLTFLGQLLLWSSSLVGCLVIDTSFHTISDFENDTYIGYLIDQRDVLFCDLREWKQVVLVCPKHKLASPLTEGQAVLSASKWNTVGIVLNWIEIRAVNLYPYSLIAIGTYLSLLSTFGDISQTSGQLGKQINHCLHPFPMLKVIGIEFDVVANDVLQ